MKGISRKLPTINEQELEHLKYRWAIGEISNKKYDSLKKEFE